MKKILLALLVSVSLFASDATSLADQNVTTSQVEETAPKSGFESLSPLGKVAYVAAMPVLAAGFAVTVATHVVIGAPVDALKFAAKKISGEE